MKKMRMNVESLSVLIIVRGRMSVLLRTLKSCIQLLEPSHGRSR